MVVKVQGGGFERGGEDEDVRLGYVGNATPRLSYPRPTEHT